MTRQDRIGFALIALAVALAIGLGAAFQPQPTDPIGNLILELTP